MTAMPRSTGFTLIELMIVIVVVAILAAIAFPSYQSYVLKAGRTDAKASLLFNAQLLERCFTQNNTYLGCNNLLSVSQEGRYNIDVVDNTDILATSYSLTATPTGRQSNDVTRCASFTLTNQGGQTATGSLGNDCWN